MKFHGVAALDFPHRTCGKTRSPFASESPGNSRLWFGAMAREWKKREEHKATLPLTQGELRTLWSLFPNLNIVGTRWVLTSKEPDFKARLVVQGSPEDPTMMRTNSRTSSRDSFFLVLSCAAQEHWSCGSAAAASAQTSCRRNRKVALAHDAKTAPTTRM